MEIKTVSLIGLGALGVMYGHHLSGQLAPEALRIVADAGRMERYEREGVFCNGERCRFHYVTPEEKIGPADLLLITVKYAGLVGALQAAQNQVGPHTVILSLLNGISSEEIVGNAFGVEKVLYSVAQGMDAVKVGNQMTYQHMGMICFGDGEPGVRSEKTEAAARFFDRTGLSFEVSTDMRRKLWSKFMVNVGVNQTAALFSCGYGGIQSEGIPRDTMIAAMREVLLLSEWENVHLTQEDLDFWLRLLAGLNPEGKPSLQQDIEAKRHSEVELFAGTALALGEKHGLSLPVNRMLYEKIKEMESKF
jgi:2-dehydropantoate 2-reductase